MSEIKSIHGRQILDSRGNPTVEAEITLVMESDVKHPFLQVLQRVVKRLLN